ncbi:MAG: phytoene/squalene synthase family protein [Actinomycetes bacterium]
MTTLEASYARCRELNRAHGTTYYASTFLLPRPLRPHVHALYGFCRHADDIVDDLGPAPTEARAEALAEFGERFRRDLAAGDSDDLVLKAVVDTVRRFDIGDDCFRRFLHSMTMDLTVATYETFDDLMEYMDGSAAVIGEMMLPILGPSDLAAATGPARDLGVAFQLTNFLRDVGEDLERGRVYLPQEDLRRFGVDPFDRRVDAAWHDLMAFEIARTREFYASSVAGRPFLPPASRRCIRVAHRMYGAILGRIEANGDDVFTRRARVSTPRRVGMVAGAYLTRA